MDIQKITSFIDKIASLPGNDDPDAIWPCILSSAFTSANQGPLVKFVYLRATQSQPASARVHILRRIKEALLKGTMLYGIPRVLNAFYPLSKVIPDEESIDYQIVRAEYDNPLSQMLVERGLKLFENIYRSDMQLILDPMDKLFPDLRVLTVHLEYGMYLSENKILSPIETSMNTIASLLPMDLPTQVKWHMRGLLRNDGSLEQLNEAMTLSTAVVDILEMDLKGGIPTVEELEETLFKS